LDLPRVLHAGSGLEPLPASLGDCEEVRLDIDPDTKPDIVASILDLGDIGPFSTVYSSHTLEHVYPHQVPVVLREFHRVLSPGGHAIIFVPDLEGLSLSQEALFESPRGPITAMDLFYGFAPAIELNPHMAHHTGFTSQTLESALREAGFARVITRRLDAYNVLAIAEK